MLTDRSSAIVKMNPQAPAAVLEPLILAMGRQDAQALEEFYRQTRSAVYGMRFRSRPTALMRKMCCRILLSRPILQPDATVRPASRWPGC